MPSERRYHALCPGTTATSPPSPASHLKAAGMEIKEMPSKMAPLGQEQPEHQPQLNQSSARTTRTSRWSPARCPGGTATEQERSKAELAVKGEDVVLVLAVPTLREHGHQAGGRGGLPGESGRRAGPAIRTPGGGTAGGGCVNRRGLVRRP